MQEKLFIIDKRIIKFFEHKDNKQHESGDSDTYYYTGMFVVFLPCVTKPTTLNLTIFLFVDIDLTSLIDYPPLANSHDTNTSLHSPANAYSNTVSGSEEEEKSVDDETKESLLLIQMTKILQWKKLRSQVV